MSRSKISVCWISSYLKKILSMAMIKSFTPKWCQGGEVFPPKVPGRRGISPQDSRAARYFPPMVPGRRGISFGILISALSSRDGSSGWRALPGRALHPEGPMIDAKAERNLLHAGSWESMCCSGRGLAM